MALHRKGRKERKAEAYFDKFNSKDSANFITLSGISLNFLFSPRWISYTFESSNKTSFTEILSTSSAFRNKLNRMVATEKDYIECYGV